MKEENYHFDERVIEKKKRDKKEIHKRVRDREIADIKKLLSIPEGRRVIWRILEESGIFKSSFTGNSTTFFNEGKRDIGLLVLEEVMKADMGKFTQMQSEFVNEQKIINTQLGEIDAR